MSVTRSGPTWEETSSPVVHPTVRQFEVHWLSSNGARPHPRDYLPEDQEQRQAVLPALLRADLLLRWRNGEKRPIEWYKDQFPELDDDSLVALLYEEYCLREEEGEAPEEREYQDRFPDLARSFQEVLAIHDLVGQARASFSRAARQVDVPLPDAGETIAGYRLVEELGRGAFARVYLAEEQHLANRQVALKVTWTGSREPQTLARLQHTHIVPVYSYQTDAGTGLHLLCMPYLGRTTLLQVLNRPEIHSARSGADLLDLLDRLLAPGVERSVSNSSRQELRRRSYAQAIAWWGAHLAEALHHAHDRGVLHRDIKPSNVLVTDDGVPMLLDFNLAQEPLLDKAGCASGGAGGTLAYMAPEHLEALADGCTQTADPRSDIYSLGVVLLDCLIRGRRTFAPPSKATTVYETLVQAAESRRAPPVRVRAMQPDVPPALEVVVRRCLAPEPADRYTNAGELAADLHAVADDGPLRFSREPFPSRIVRWLRRNRQRLAVFTLLTGVLAATAFFLISAELAAFRLEQDARHGLEEGQRSLEANKLELALSQFETAGRLARETGRLPDLSRQITEHIELARQSKEIRDKADSLFEAGDRIRFSLLGLSGDSRTACKAVEAALAAFGLPEDHQWISRPPILLLDWEHRERLLGEANDLMFLWAWALDRDRASEPSVVQKVLRLCDAALSFAEPKGPWNAMQERSRAFLAGELEPAQIQMSPSGETSARGCFQLAHICELERRTEAASEWLERATALEPSNYWSQFYSGYYHSRLNQNDRAFENYQAAVALRPDSPWARYNRALLSRARGDFGLALDDLNRVVSSPQGASLPDAFLELGIVKEALGDPQGAREAYERVIKADRNGLLARAGRLNRARLDFAAGAIKKALREYDDLLAEDRNDHGARLSRALVAVRSGQFAQAESDLTILLSQLPERSDEILARRALARLAAGRLEGSEADAAGSFRRRPMPSRERLWVRTLLALERVDDLCWLERPEDLAVLPAGGRSIRADLRAAARLLASSRGGGSSGSPSVRAARTRAVILSALGDPTALAVAEDAVVRAPESVEALLVRAHVRRRSGQRRAALLDVESGLALAPGDTRLLELRGLLKTETGRAESGLIDLDRAITLGARGSIRMARAAAEMALKRYEEATRDWTLAVEFDPEDARAYLGRACALLWQGHVDRAMVDLEKAAEWAVDNPGLLARITIAYGSCLAARPSRIARVLQLAERTWSSSMALAEAPRTH
jgi:serine/threonine protein kinase/Tfp pilus assembly protein PilF